ncbi:hypothetical protein DB895_02045 [Flavobacterium psychrotolerans]|uniref:Uncharacterized protein n=1 Tax=Flavobacterium psychrotolerans TaxID=2169410 RepID=A0A2U1JNN9_9FLAO|nr:hypothetical protein DB895_02045 [Flavobacterium psychrotolerans]
MRYKKYADIKKTNFFSRIMFFLIKKHSKIYIFGRNLDKVICVCIFFEDKVNFEDGFPFNYGRMRIVFNKIKNK